MVGVRLRLLLLAALVAFPAAAAQAAAGPLAYFEVSPSQTATGKTVVADASLSRGAAEYAWRWSAAESYQPGNVTETHAYRDAGVFEIGLRVTDGAGRVAFANQSVLVEGSRPSAYFTFDQQTPQGPGLHVVVNATFSEPSRGAKRIARYHWAWGDDTPGYDGNVTETHDYASIGQYKVTLTVTDDAGRSALTNNSLTVKSTFLTRMLEVWQFRSFFLQGAKLTVELAIVTTLVGFVLALALATMRISRLPFLRWPAAVYIEFIRGTPLLVQVLVAWLVLPELGLKLPILWAGGLALIVNTSAYQAEAIRAGIQSIPTGQMEAATSLGMTNLQAMRHIILPQAFRLTLPALGNEFIILLKDTSLVGVIGVVELAQAARIISARTFLVLETFLLAALIYFVMTYALSTGLRWLEKRLAIPGMGVTGASP
ncbi:MAG: arginine/lysine/histidine transport system permease protein [Thermoplasmata archaeon]|nr:arginine/lysine/histidine transport system permease protein [Thermoplasmata archaeon]